MAGEDRDGTTFPLQSWEHSCECYRRGYEPSLRSFSCFQSRAAVPCTGCRLGLVLLLKVGTKTRACSAPRTLRHSLLLSLRQEPTGRESETERAQAQLGLLPHRRAPGCHVV